jgi:hypothetical protein
MLPSLPQSSPRIKREVQETAQHLKKLLDQVRDALRLKHYSMRTETSCVAWPKRYILFHNQQHPLALGNSEMEAFLSPSRCES